MFAGQVLQFPELNQEYKNKKSFIPRINKNFIFHILQLALCVISKCHVSCIIKLFSYISPGLILELLQPKHKTTKNHTNLL